MTQKELQKRIEHLEKKLNKTIVIRCTSMPNVNVGNIIVYNGILYYWNGNDYEAVATNIELENAIGGIGIGTNIHVVNTWQDLPLPTNLNAGHFYWVENSTGTRWLPGSLGGTYHSRGLYYSTGTEWEDAPVPYQASQAEVNAGIKEDKFVTPKTLKNAAQWDTKVDKSITVEGINSISGAGDLSANIVLELENDQYAPGPNMTYGTDSSGVKGYKPDPVGGGGVDIFSWLSGDTKPTDVLVGSFGIEVDTGDSYYYDGTIWSKTTDVGEVNTVSNVGSGTGVYKSKTGVNFEFKSLVAGNNITFDISNSNEIKIHGTAGTVTSVGLSTGTSGTDINVSGSPITTSGTFTLNIPTASSSNRGVLSSTDWSIFNNKVGGVGVSPRVAFWDSTNTLSNSANLYWDNSGSKLYIKDIPYTSYATGQVSIGNDAGKLATGASYSVFLGGNAGNGATNALQSFFLGVASGLGATDANFSVFAGTYAGSTAINAQNSNFFGFYAGEAATNASFSNFFGSQSGRGASGANNSNFFGQYSGQNTNAYSSNFFGNQVGRNATSANNSNFFGTQSGINATYAAQSNMIGAYSGGNATNANRANFFGLSSGYDASNASYSNFFGYNTGRTFSGNNVGSNNIIIGSNISLPNATANAMNIGGVLFGKGFNNVYSGDPIIVPISGGKIGIMKVSPATTLDVDGDFQVSVRTGTPTKLSGFDANGKIMDVTVSTGLTLSSGVLNTSGFSGTFKTGDSKIVTVVNGIITSVV